jgi:hypothetical protein
MQESQEKHRVTQGTLKHHFLREKEDKVSPFFVPQLSQFQGRFCGAVLEVQRKIAGFPILSHQKY